MKKLSLSLAAAVALMFSAAAQADCYSEGIRSGMIQKFSKKGLIVKTWEGEMVQEGIRGKGAQGNRTITNIWKFSVTDAAIAKKVEDAMFTGGPVTLKYCQNLIKFKGIADTDYIITNAMATPK